MAKSTGTRKGKRKETEGFPRWKMWVGAILGPIFLLFLCPSALLDDTPRLKATLEWSWHRFMIMALVGSFAWMAWVAHGGPGNLKLFLEIAVPATLVAIRYGPWYMLVGAWPYWILCSAAMATCYGGCWEGGGLVSQNNLTGGPLATWTMWWYLGWLFYPFVRGVFHQIGWERERIHQLERHKIVNHPHALMATAAAITALTSLPSKKERQKPE